MTSARRGTSATAKRKVVFLDNSVFSCDHAPALEASMSDRITLILLPGMLCDEAYWGEHLEALADLADVVVAAYPAKDTIADMALGVIAEAPPRFAVAGHSMGGRVALEIAARAPDRLLGLGLFGTDYRGFRSDDERAAEAEARRKQLAAADERGFEVFARDWAQHTLAAARRADEALVERIVRMASRLGRAAMEAHGKAGLSRPDYEVLLPTIAVPTLVIAGSADEMRPPEPLRRIAAAVPGARFALIEGAGHMLSMERPDQVTAEIRTWLGEIIAGRRADA
jgi:pimeloyl-ACP methyl ester carboxylesterase